MVFLGILGWLVVGVIVGFIATKLVNLRGDDPRLSVGAAGIAAVVAGAIYSIVSGDGVSAFNVWSIAWAAGGGVAGAVLWHAVRSRFISHDGYTVRRSY